METTTPRLIPRVAICKQLEKDFLAEKDEKKRAALRREDDLVARSAGGAAANRCHGSVR